jgi:hypothetical protein
LRSSEGLVSASAELQLQGTASLRQASVGKEIRKEEADILSFSRK